MSSSTDIVIIGAGFSGLAAARIFQQNKKNFVLLEARDRLGGRTYTKRFDDGTYLDLGGQWIGPTQDRMYALAEEYGVNWYATFNEGKNIIDLNQSIKHYKGLIPTMDVLSLLNIDYVLKKLERMARQIPQDQPWKAKDAAHLDSMSLASFVSKHCYTKNCYKVVRAGLETVYACELNEVSLLHALFYIRSGTNLNNLLSIENGAQQHRIKGGMQSLAEKIATPFLQHLRLNHPVKQIIQNDAGVLVKGEGFSIQAKKVIIAIPPVLISEIQIEPALPLLKTQLLQKMSMGIVGKVMAIYKKPFWRAAGLSGQVVSDEHMPFQTLFDSSPSDAEYGVLLAFCIANRARDFFRLTEKDRQRIALENFARYFGSEALSPVRYVDHCWADEAWSKGCYAGLYPTGAWSNFQDILAKPCNNIHFAGTETSSIWYGYIEGAVRSGERAAQEVIDIDQKSL